MKKTLLLNSVLSELIASLGHGDMVVIGDAGLPIPPETRRIDLALCRGIPPLLETVRVIASEMQVEKALIATETGQRSPHIRDGLGQLLPNTPFEEVSHEQLKALCRQARAVVRTGEYTPYANVILVAGVVF
ncbi:D-ribose pyranase [Chloroflexus aggregans]|uniref:D-ribose pyranase n=1 Tax=Chloroflexus aggregans (strain MD-66 / DSM 9485) TaxID=326427 RepID=RBSD_CHLAD|nr:D-ribose pyranase [Chloroflexus aggregans]B8G635.1 RecName: Full=D-ribose pyranase [Chloroflexus aggregans DSM 9485]ACL25768.1 RbsD or FucU transport [Chloroflexus aggregans DSM 9485]